MSGRAEHRYTEEQLEKLRAVFDSQLVTTAAVLFEDDDDNDHAIRIAAARALDLRDEILILLDGERK